MQIVDKKTVSWFERNQRWTSPLLCSFMLMLAVPMVQVFSMQEPPINIPSLVYKVALAASCIGLAWGGFQAFMTDTASARVICPVGALAGYVLAIFLFMNVLGT